MKKSITQRLVIGLKKGYITPTLPDNIIKLNSLLYIRVLRFLGGVSFLIILGKSYIQCSTIVLLIAMFIAFIFTCYHFYLTYYRIKHMIKVLRSDEFDIKI